MSIATIKGKDVFVCSLDEALNYDGADMIERFLRRFDVSDDEAAELFEDIKRWLWLAGSARVDRVEKRPGVPDRLVIDTPMLIVDQMWHNFVCFTKEYDEYCKSKFGRFIHHAPTTEAQSTRIRERVAENPTFQIDKKRVQYGYVYDKLGETVLKRWYVDYPRRFTAEKILSLRKL